MLNNKYIQLTPLERSLFIGKLVHSVQSDEDMFDIASSMIKASEKLGLFEGIVILPDNSLNKSDGKEE